MAVRVKGTRRVEHRRCRVQHSFKCRNCVVRIFEWTLLNWNGFYRGAPHSTSGKWDAINRGPRFTKTIPRWRNRVEKTSKPRKGIQGAFFGYATIRFRPDAIIVVYLWETFVLAGCGPRNYNRVKSYGCPSKGDPKGGTSTMHGATFL